MNIDMNIISNRQLDIDLDITSLVGLWYLIPSTCYQRGQARTSQMVMIRWQLQAKDHQTRWQDKQPSLYRNSATETQRQPVVLQMICIRRKPRHPSKGLACNTRSSVCAGLEHKNAQDSLQGISLRLHTGTPTWDSQPMRNASATT